MTQLALFFIFDFFGDFLNLILNFFHDLGLSWGLSIVALTFIVRLCLMPLNWRQVKAMHRLQELQPQIKALQEKYKNSPERKEKLTKETMAVYQDNKINPLGALMPIFLQIPVFISLFYLLKGSDFKQQISGEQSFLFLPDLSATLGSSPGLLVIMFLLYFVTQAAAIILSARERERKVYLLAFGLPFLIIFVIAAFPAGVLVYWVTSNIWSIGQGLFFKKVIPAPNLTEVAAHLPEVVSGESDQDEPTKPSGQRKANRKRRKRRKRKR